MDENTWHALVDHLRGNSQFLAGCLPHSGHDLAIALHVDVRTALRILVCRQPRPTRWNDDIRSIADHVGVPPVALEALLVAWIPNPGVRHRAE